MSFYPTFFLTKAFAADGDKTLPPATAGDAGRGRFSQALGFDPLTETPLTEGGVPPNRSDLNGVLNVIGQFLMWFQRGGVMRWSATMAYEPGCEVLHNGTKYRCKTACTNIAPPNTTYWKNLDSNFPVGMICQFGNVVAIDSNGHPKFSGQTEFDLTWALCDGRNGTPDYVGRFARGGNSAAVSTRGSGSFTLSEANLPAHSHTATVSTNGAHTHERGTMNITGTCYTNNADTGIDDVFTGSGAFTARNGSHNCAGGGRIWSTGWEGFSFNAADGWTGATTQNGSHSHTVTIGSTGSGTAVSFEPSNVTAPFFMKIAEG